MTSGYETIGDIIHRYHGLIARLREPKFIDLVDQIGITLDDLNLEWLQESFEQLAQEFITAGFKIELICKVHDIDITINSALLGKERVVQKRKHEPTKVFARRAVLLSNKKAKANYSDLQNLIDGTPETGGTGIGDILEKLQALEEYGVGTTAEVTFRLNKQPLIDELKNSAPDGEKLSVSCFFFPETLENILVKATLSKLEDSLFPPDKKEDSFHPSDKKTVIVIFGVEGLLQGDFLSVCGDCSLDEIEVAFQATDKTKLKEFKERHQFRSKTCNLQGVKRLLPDSLATAAHTQDETLLAIHYELKAFEALLSVLSLANRVSESEAGQYEVFFEGRRESNRPVNFLVSRDDLKQEYIKEEEQRKKSSSEKGEEEEPNVQAILMLYDWAYKEASYDKLGMARNMIALRADDWERFLQNAANIKKSVMSSYDFFMGTKIESYFETRRKIRELVSGFARETATEVARLTKEVNENIYKTAGLVAGAVIAALIKPENTSLILGIGCGLVIIFLLIILLYHLPTMCTQFINRRNQYEDDVRSFDQVLGKDEIQGFINDRTIAVQRKLFFKEVDKANMFYGGFIIAVVVALRIFLIVQHVVSD